MDVECLLIWPQHVLSTEKDIDTRLTKAWTAIDRLSIIEKSDLTDKMKRSFFQAAAIDHNIDRICMQELRYTHSEDIKYHDNCNGWTLAIASAWKNSVNATIGDVGMLIGPRALKSLNSIEKIQPRMIRATFNVNPRATIISCLGPTNVSEETDLIAFYNELSSIVHSNVPVIGVDMNV